MKNEPLFAGHHPGMLMGSLPVVKIQIYRTRPDSLDHEGEEYVLESNPAIVGRSNDCEVTLRDRTVSRIHLRIDRDSERMVITNLSQKSPTIIDGSTLSPGERFESTYRSFRMIVGTLQLKLLAESLHAARASDFSRERTLDTDIALVNRTLDVPELRSLTSAHNRSERRASEPPFLHVYESRAACTISIRGKWIDLPRMTALALSALCKQAGSPVAEEVIERAADSESMVTKHVSLSRTAIREMIERGDLEREEIHDQMRSFPDFRDEDLDEMDLNKLMRKFIGSRRGFGYILFARKEDIEVELSR